MRKATIYIILTMAAILLIASCASIGTPSGGPRDEDPPRFVSSSPLQGAVDVTPQKVVLTFNELVTLKDAFSKVVMSPPPATTPRYSSLGRRVTVEFRDSLLPETTYTIDFGDAIADNNEGNQMDNFIYTFSTGPVLDTLMISGMVLGAEDLQPAAGMYVGLHTVLEDSAFTKNRFERVAKADNNGHFVIAGLAPGNYRVYALGDMDGDLKWSSPDESLAFYDAIISPTAELATATDTIFNLFTGEVDTIVQRGRTRFLPNNILLRSFNTGYAQQYITRYERQDSTVIHFTFNTAADSMPKMNIVMEDGSSIPLPEVSITERSATNDTLYFWLRNPELISRDTLNIAVEYLKADSAYNMVPYNDTLRLLTPRPQAGLKKTEKKTKALPKDTVPPPVPTKEIKVLNSKPEVYQPLTLMFQTPLDTLDFSMLRLETKEDSVWRTAEEFDIGMLARDTLNPRIMRLNYPWKYERSYKLTIDSLAGRDIYGIFTDDLVSEFTTRAEKDYGSLKFNLTNMGSDTIPRFVQLLDTQGNPLFTLPLEGKSVTFRYLLPAKYYVRVVEDRNGNQKYDPGDFLSGVLPDVSYYYKDQIELKANWDQEIDWNVFGTPVDKMLPEALRKKNPNSGR